MAYCCLNSSSGKLALFELDAMKAMAGRYPLA